MRNKFSVFNVPDLPLNRHFNLNRGVGRGVRRHGRAGGGGWEGLRFQASGGGGESLDAGSIGVRGWKIWRMLTHARYFGLTVPGST